MVPKPPGPFPTQPGSSLPLGPIESALKPVPNKFRKRGLDAVDLQKMNSFLGFSLKATHPSSYRSLLGHTSGHTMIDPEETLLAMRKSLNLLKKVTFRGGRTLIVSTNPMLARLTRVIAQQSGQFFLAKRWVPGILTNWDKGRGFVRRTLALDPRLMTAGRCSRRRSLSPPCHTGRCRASAYLLCFGGPARLTSARAA